MILSEAVLDVGILLLQLGQLGLDCVDAGAFLNAGDGFHRDARIKDGLGRLVAGFRLHAQGFCRHQVLVQALEAVDHDVLGVLERYHTVGFHEGLEGSRLQIKAGTEFVRLLLEFCDAAVRDVQTALPVAGKEGLDDSVDDVRRQLGILVFDADIEDVPGFGGGGLDHLGEFLDGVLSRQKFLILGENARLQDRFHDAGGGQQLDVRLHDVVLGNPALVVDILRGSQVDAAGLDQQTAGRGVAGRAGPGVEHRQQGDEGEDAQGNRPALEHDGNVIQQVQFVLDPILLAHGNGIIERRRIHGLDVLSVGLDGCRRVRPRWRKRRR